MIGLLVSFDQAFIMDNTNKRKKQVY